MQEDRKIKNSSAADAGPIGDFTIKVIRGQLHRNTEFFGQMDPFVSIEYKGKKYKTNTLDEAG